MIHRFWPFNFFFFLLLFLWTNANTDAVNNQTVPVIFSTILITENAVLTAQLAVGKMLFFQCLCAAVNERHSETRAPHSSSVCPCVRACEATYSITSKPDSSKTAEWMTLCLHCTKTSCAGTVDMSNKTQAEEEYKKSSVLCPSVPTISDFCANVMKYSAERNKSETPWNYLHIFNTIRYLLQFYILGNALFYCLADR